MFYVLPKIWAYNIKGQKKISISFSISFHLFSFVLFLPFRLLCILTSPSPYIQFPLLCLLPTDSLSFSKSCTLEARRCDRSGAELTSYRSALLTYLSHHPVTPIRGLQRLILPVTKFPRICTRVSQTVKEFFVHPVGTVRALT